MIIKQDNLSSPQLLKTMRYRLIRFLAGKSVVLLNADVRASQNTGIALGASAKNLLCANCCFPDGTTINYWQGGFTGYRTRPAPDTNASVATDPQNMPGHTNT